jgi:hypothetical protein
LENVLTDDGDIRPGINLNVTGGVKNVGWTVKTGDAKAGVV